MEMVQGYCEKHRQGDGTPMPKVDRGGESVCMFCESELSPKTGITKHVEDPGDEEMRQVLKKAGIVVPPSTGKAPMPDVPKPVRTNLIPQKMVSPIEATFEEKVDTALKIMKSLPMPANMKQVKAVLKIIGGMENLLGEK